MHRDTLTPPHPYTPFSTQRKTLERRLGLSQRIHGAVDATVADFANQIRDPDPIQFARNIVEAVEQLCVLDSKTYGPSGPGHVPDPWAIVVVHSIDGPSLRKPQAQHALSLLAASPRIGMIASTDHVNAALLWDSELQGRFSWIWQDTTSYDPFEDESRGETVTTVSTKTRAATQVCVESKPKINNNNNKTVPPPIKVSLTYNLTFCVFC